MGRGSPEPYLDMQTMISKWNFVGQSFSFILLLFSISGCMAGSLRPNSDWNKLSAPPSNASEILAHANQKFPKNVVWYTKQDDEYLVYVPPDDEDGCGEEAIIFTKVPNGWVQEPWGRGKGGSEMHLCVD